MAHLSRQNIPAPKAVVLESPFNNIDSEIRYHPMSRLFRNLPWFDYMVSRPMYSNHLRFQSDQHIGEFREPVMIMHAEDDLVIPFELGYRVSHVDNINHSIDIANLSLHKNIIIVSFVF